MNERDENGRNGERTINTKQNKCGVNPSALEKVCVRKVQMTALSPALYFETH